MTLKYHGPGDDCHVVHRWEHGLTWMAHPDEGMQRASHALAVEDDERNSAASPTDADADVWLVDPIYAEGLDEELADLGDVAGVVVLTNSHGRHADRLAARHDVAVHVPACFDDPESTFDAPVEPFADELADTGFELVWEKAGAGWKEGMLYHPDRRTLVVADALMTSLFTGEDGQLELFPPFRWSPPRPALGSLAVDRVLVGHGHPVVEDAQAALDEALAVSRRGVPSAIARSLPTFARITYNEIRG